MSASKKVVFYADLSENRKRLNFATDVRLQTFILVIYAYFFSFYKIVLTLSPADADSLPKNANPLVWKVRHVLANWHRLINRTYSQVLRFDPHCRSLSSQY
jgi:hypothetical protein